MKKDREKIKKRIIDAAEQVFANCGIEGTSIRKIVKRAQVNLATVYYYFGSKEGLVIAILERRFGSVYKQHKELIRKFRESDGTYTLEQVLEAMLTPPLQAAESEPSKAHIIRKLIGRIVSDPHPKVHEILYRRHKDVREGFFELIHKAVPHLKEADLQWRLEFIWGALAFLMSNPQKLEKMSNGACNPLDTKTALKQMIQFFAAGLRAPSAEDLNFNNELRNI